MSRFQMWALFALVAVAGLVSFADAGLLFFRRRCAGSSCNRQSTYAPCAPACPSAPCPGPNCPVCPVCPVDTGRVVDQAVAGELYGVDRSTGVGKVDSICVGGTCTPTKTGQTKTPATLMPEDADKRFFVVVGDDAFQKKAVDVLHRHRVDEAQHVVCFHESDWQAKDVGYGKGVWLVDARGKNGKAAVLSLDDDLVELDKSLGRHSEALRKQDGILDRLKVPNLSKALDPAAMVWSGVAPYVPAALNLTALSAFGLAFLRKGA